MRTLTSRTLTSRSLTSRTLTFETLEDRCVPAVTNPVNEITGLYRQVLLRDPDAIGLQTHVARLENGESLKDIAASMWNSNEFRTAQVEKYYAQYLHRAADATGLAHWVSELQSGASEYDVIAGFTSSAEYWDKAGANNADFVGELYWDLLGRGGDSAGIATWTNRLVSGGSRESVVMAISRSMEFKSVSLSGMYQWILGREVDSAGEAQWTSMDDNGYWLKDVSTSILGSAENTQRVSALTQVIPPNRAAQQLYFAMMTSNYDQFYSILAANYSDPEFVQQISMGLLDGFARDEVTPSVRTSFATTQLRPTQNVIVMENSLSFVLTNGATVSSYLAGGTFAVAGRYLVTGNDGTFIIDGHHRWSQLFLVNPNTRIEVNDLPEIQDPFMALEASQLAIVVDTDSLPSSSGSGSNLYTVGEGDFSDYVIATMNAGVRTAFATFGYTSDAEIVDYLWGNVLRLRTFNQPITGAAAPPRELMPQTDDAPNFFALLGSGEINYRQLTYYRLG